MTSITFLLHGPMSRPGGGIKVILEYASRLAQDGYGVNIVYPAAINLKRGKRIKNLIKVGFHYAMQSMKGWRTTRWFRLPAAVKEWHVTTLDYKNIPPSDIYIATEARTAPWVASYPVNRSRKFYFIQGYEDWVLSEQQLFETYRLPLNKIVIAPWLGEAIAAQGESFTVVENSFDFDYFVKSKEITERSPFTVATYYDGAPHKGFDVALEALTLVHDEYPQLKVLIFGKSARPDQLPEWFEYHQQPNRATHNMIYNDASIFVGASRKEGWGLTVGEAMACGAAIACTDINGYRVMVKDGTTGLLSPVNDAKALADNIIKLINDDDLRQRLAVAGHQFILQFNRDNSYGKFKRRIMAEQDSSQDIAEQDSSRDMAERRSSLVQSK